MGTRGITKVIYDGETKVAQYGQWDHYPSGVGLGILSFLRGEGNLDRLKINIKDKVYEIAEDELDKIVSEFSPNGDRFMTSEQADAFSTTYPSLTRDTGGAILDLIAAADEPLPLVLDLEFEQDKLFCEGMYTVDLDNNMFISRYAEVYVGFDLNQLPTDEEYISAFALDTVAVE